MRETPGGNVIPHHHRVVGGGGVQLQRPEVALGIAVHFQGGQERGVEIARGKTEVGSLVLLHYGADVPGADRIRRPHHTRCPVVVGGECQGPGAGHVIIALEQFRRALGGDEGVQAGIHHVINAHVVARGGRHELPHTGGRHLGIDRGVEGGLDVGQYIDFRRQFVGGQDLANMRLPLP